MKRMLFKMKIILSCVKLYIAWIKIRLNIAYITSKIDMIDIILICSINSREKRKINIKHIGEKMKIKLESLEAVHTHTHTHTHR